MFVCRSVFLSCTVCMSLGVLLCVTIIIIIIVIVIMFMYAIGTMGRCLCQNSVIKDSHIYY